MRKGVFFLIVALPALFTLSSTTPIFSQTAASVSIPDHISSPGSVVILPVTGTGMQDIGTLQLYITFNNDVLEYLNVENIHPNLNGLLFNFSEGIVKLSWFNISGSSVPDGHKLFDLRLSFCNDLVKCAQSGSATPVYFIQDRSFITDPAYNNIPLSFNEGSVGSDVTYRTLTVSVEGDGQATVNGVLYVEPVVVVDGAELLLDVIAADGWLFDRWTGAITGSTTPQGILMDSNKEVGAVFISSGIPDNLEVSGVNLAEGESGCYNALETITVAGAGTEFVVQSQGSATFKAGRNILFLPGTRVEPGGYLKAYIVTDEEYCQPLADKQEGPVADIVTAIEPREIISNMPSFKVYPNPASGIFYIELEEAVDGGHVLIEIFNATGSSVIRQELPLERQYAFSLENQNPGIYFIRVIQNGKMSVERLIKR